jgi:ubiquinone biosynthesis protein
VSILGIAKSYKSWQRLIEIVNVLARNGFGHYLLRLNLHERFPRLTTELLRIRRVPEVYGESTESLAARITLVLQELGPTFVKLGQMLSSRPDVVPEDIVGELTKLQDHVAPFPGEDAVRIVEEEAGAKLEELFTSFERQPFASGSIGQVHYATLKDGTEVVVKVRRPGIEGQIFLDLGWLRHLADLAEKYIPELRPYRPSAVVEELERGVRRELDFVVEGSSTAKFHELFADDKDIRTPKVYWDLTTPHVLTLERIQGRKITEFARDEGSPERRRQLSRALAGAFCRQYFEFGAFHADPHPGNLLVDEAGRVALIDFGMTGYLSDALRSNLSQILIALDRKDMDIFCEIFADLGATGETTSFRELQSDLLELLDKYYSMPLKRMDTVEVFKDVTRVARRNAIVLPRDVILLAKSFVAVMTTARQLDPNFDFAGAVEPHVRNLVAQRFSPKFLAKEARSTLWHLSRLFRWLPREMSEILRKVEGGRLQFVFRHVGLDQWVTELDRSLNRLSTSIVVAAFVVGSSMLLGSQMTLPIPPFDIALPVAALGVIGYVVAFILGVFLVIGVWRSGRL